MCAPLSPLLCSAPLTISRQMAALGFRSCPHCRAAIEVDSGVDLLAASCPNPACRKALVVGSAAEQAAFDAFRRQHRLPACPQCGAVVEKTQGCNAVKCRCVQVV